MHKYPTDVYLFNSNQDTVKAPANLKQNYNKNTLSRLVWNDPDFKSLAGVTGEETAKGLDNVSAAWQGASDGQIEYRGRWVSDKGTQVVRRHYITTDDPFTDASVGSMLCDGGPIKYELADAFTVTDNWLFIECVQALEHGSKKTIKCAVYWG